MRRGILAGGVLVLCPAATAAADIIDFDDIDTTASQVVEWSGDRYLARGVLFSSHGLTLGAYRHFKAETAPNMAAGSSFDPPNTPNRGITARFVNPADPSERLATDFVSLWINDSDQGGGLWEVKIFNAADEPIGSQTGIDTDAFVSFQRSADEIHRVDFLPSPDFEGMDTFTFNAVVAPEPGSGILALAGIACLALARRRG